MPGADVYHQIRAAIVDGTFPTDTPLTETTLASQFNVSRTPVREALRRLEQDGLVERGARGMQVRARSPEEILQIYEVRIVLEGSAARAAAERRTELDVLKLEQVHAAMLAAPTADPQQLAAHNRKFHEAIWATSHNATIIDLLGRVNAHLIRYRGTTLSIEGRWTTALKEHQQLLEAIKAGDRERAGKIAEEHMAGARNARLQLYAAVESPR